GGADYPRCTPYRSAIINHGRLFPKTPDTCKYIAQASTLVFMLTSTVITAVIGVIGVVAAGIGINRIIRDPRRIAAYAYAIAGLGAALLSLGLIVFLQTGSPVLLAITMFAALALLLLGNLVGYTALVGVSLCRLGLIVFLQTGSPVLAAITMVAALALLPLGNLVGYPELVGFLLWAGITNVRRESRSLANLLALLAGIGLLLLPGTLDFLEIGRASCRERK